MTTTTDIEYRIARLQEWGRTKLVAEWERICGKAAPNRISQSLMIRTIAYKWQEETIGGLSRADQKLLDRMAVAFAENPSAMKPSLQIKTGTRLRRLWQGKVCEVTATKDGFVHEGNTYRSLSEAARAITSTRWNGPAFFGLRATKKP